MTARRNRLYGGLALAVAAGVVVRALQVLPPYIDDILGRAFPLVLIIVGLALLLRNRVPLSSFIAVTLSLVLLAAVTTTAFSVRRGQLRTDNRVEVTNAVEDGLTLLYVRLQSLTTDVEISRAPAGSENTLRALFVGSTESEINHSYLQGGDGTATFALGEVQLNPFPLLEAVGRGTLLVELPPDVPVDVQLEAVQGDVRLNLTGVALERLNLDLVTGDGLITLPAYDPTFSTDQETLGAWRVGAGSLTVRIPEPVAARFDMSRSTGPDPTYQPDEYNLLFGRDLLEARSIDSAAITVRYDLIVSRDTLTVTGVE